MIINLIKVELIFSRQGKYQVANEKETINKFVSNLEIDPVIKSMSVDEIKKIIEKNSSEMNKAADKLDFYEAARLRDENIELQKILENKS